MGSDDPRTYFVITTRGDRGPMDRAGIRELLKSGEVQREDHVRNAFGRPLGTVAGVLGSSDPARSSRPRMVPPQPAPERRGALLPILIVAVLILAGAGLWLTSGGSAPAPVPVPIQTPAVSTPATPASPAPAAAIGSALHLDDLGGSLPAGTMVSDVGALRLAGSGTEIGGKKDSGAFAHRQTRGNVTLTVRVLAVQDVAIGEQAGLMLRNDLGPGAAHVALWARSTGLVSLGRRSETGKAAVIADGPKLAFPLWLRLERIGNRVTASTSPDGTTWTAFPQVQVMPAFTDSLIGGLMVCSRKPTQLCTATFDRLDISGQ